MSENVSINTEKLLFLIKSFYELIGIKIAIYNTDFEEIFSYPEKSSEFCTQMHSFDSIRKKCDLCTSSMAKLCAQTKQTHKYTCHAGLCEVIAPLESNGIEIGYIICGQVTNNANREAFAQDVVSRIESYGINTDEIKPFLGEIKYFSNTQLDSIIEILKVLTSYIVLQKLVYAKNVPVGIAVLDYINNNLTLDLSVNSLCKHFAMSRSNLYNATKDYMPNGIAEYVRSARLEAVKNIMGRNSALTVREAVEKAGFKSYDYFLRLYKAKNGKPFKKSFKE